MKSSKFPQQMSRQELMVYFIHENKQPQPPDPIANSTSSARVPLAPKRPDRQPLISVPLDVPRPPTPDDSASRVLIDWYGQAHSVAEAAIDTTRSKSTTRAFDHKAPSDATRDKESLFGPPPVHRAGTWDGPDRFYVTDNCAYEYDHAPPPPPTALDHRLKTPVCKKPPQGGGDAMFKDLTPNYLKDIPTTKSP